jgi:hypothetical protein
MVILPARPDNSGKALDRPRSSVIWNQTILIACAAASRESSR